MTLSPPAYHLPPFRSASLSRWCSPAPDNHRRSRRRCGPSMSGSAPLAPAGVGGDDDCRPVRCIFGGDVAEDAFSSCRHLAGRLRRCSRLGGTDAVQTSGAVQALDVPLKHCRLHQRAGTLPANHRHRVCPRPRVAVWCRTHTIWGTWTPARR